MKVESEWEYIPSVFMVYENIFRVYVHSGVHGVYTHTHTNTHTHTLYPSDFSRKGVQVVNIMMSAYDIVLLLLSILSVVLSLSLRKSWHHGHRPTSSRRWVNEK